MTALPSKLRYAVFARDDYRCVYCGVMPKGSERHVDHVIPRSKGGPDTFENLVTACRECNYAKRANLLSFAQMLDVAPHLRYEAEYIEQGRLCSKCGNRIEYGGDSFCTCRRDEEPLCDCGEPLDGEHDELCAGCYSRLYVYCWDCGEVEQPEDDRYCAACQAKERVFRGGIEL